MNKLTTILLLVSMLVSTLAYSQNGRTSTTNPQSETTKSWNLPQGSFTLGTNLSYGNENLNSNDDVSSSSSNSQAYGLNLNAGYMLTKTTQLGINCSRNFYTYDRSYNNKTNDYSYGLSISQYLLKERFAPFITLSSSRINGKGDMISYQTSETPYKGWNVILSAGVIYHLVNNFYLQANVNFITYQNIEYTFDNGFGNSTVNNQQFLLGINQPISLGLFYNFRK